MEKMNLLERFLSKRKDFVEILNTNTEENLQFVLERAEENYAKIQSIIPFYESQSGIEEIYSPENRFDPTGSLNVIEFQEKSLIRYLAYERIGFQKYLDDKEISRVENLILEREKFEEKEKKEKEDEEKYRFIIQSKESYPKELISDIEILTSKTF